ncbi:InlB B-repeat-containing protein [Legionella longbeachae]|uniref:Bacterial repeat domain-containing protein n=1 Tax=Legionella longbeachae serogroup 1 (strain NSW150) TaxID=661367 RepID=D3HT62_LEGLN|nr:DUF1566 domain-containing protein [Legionella longbeachae]VEE02596.1 transmembrane protein (fibronectin III domain and Gp5 C-terminal repeat) [Legionella oakridgensis]HBD7397858.1 DUF1566 domain-containing protein [Legionella pneumophila]ARB91138.1 DUF1566 domain-containing protein [Legionella longbeachae]ARM32434.1 DUF1566 domain-containing protein [Legionella longbeachae]EEZ94757.1 conserved hypothetical protein [Legionella longbeachae D-4968]
MSLINKAIIVVVSFLLSVSAQAKGATRLNIEFTALTPTNITLAPTEIKRIEYIVKNTAIKDPQYMVMKEIPGIHQVYHEKEDCEPNMLLLPGRKCRLVLEAKGNELKGDIFGGPELCFRLFPLICSQPSTAIQLSIQLINQPEPPLEYMITPNATDHGSIKPNITQKVKQGSTITFNAAPETGYGVSDWFVDEKQVQKGGHTFQLRNVTTHHKVKVSFGKATLTPNVSQLSLSVACSSTNPSCAHVNTALTGASRQFIITNLGSIDATNVAVESSGLPQGTKFSTTCSNELQPNDSCTVTVFPGSVASSGAEGTPCTSGIQPIPGKIAVTSDNGFSTQLSVFVLGYGCIYQGGYIYSIDDTFVNGSIRGKVVNSSDQTERYHEGIIWSSNGSGRASCDVHYAIHGINEKSATPCKGGANGQCNTGYILNYYSPVSSYPLAYYAAGLCKMDIEGYSDWYLPAICELGYEKQDGSCGSGCLSSQQNIQANLVEKGIGGFSGYYWSSTEYSNLPMFYAWFQNYSSSGEHFQLYDFKLNQFKVRCSRDLTA